MVNTLNFKIPENLLKELSKALNGVGGWGSVEIYVQNGEVSQITSRTIKKIKHHVQVKS